MEEDFLVVKVSEESFFLFGALHFSFEREAESEVSFGCLPLHIHVATCTCTRGGGRTRRIITLWWSISCKT